jgi:hypothetical protein
MELHKTLREDVLSETKKEPEDMKRLTEKQKAIKKSKKKE